MKINAITDEPELLVKAINKAIKDGHLKTWKIVYNTKQQLLYSHKPPQWDEEAMIKPNIEEDKVRFSISWWKKNGEPAREIKGYILGRFTEILIVHFKNYFSHLESYA